MHTVNYNRLGLHSNYSVEIANGLQYYRNLCTNDITCRPYVCIYVCMYVYVCQKLFLWNYCLLLFTKESNLFSAKISTRYKILISSYIATVNIVHLYVYNIYGRFAESLALCTLNVTPVRTPF